MAYTAITPNENNEYVYEGAENAKILGGAGDDKLTGNTGDDRIIGGDGNDTIVGRAGEDWITGGNGNDSLQGDAANDLLDGSDGFDKGIFSGGARDYQFSFAKNAWTVKGPDGTDTLRNIEELNFTGSGDTLYLDGRNNAPLANAVNLSVPEDGPALTGLDLLALSKAWDFEKSALSVGGVTGGAGKVTLSNGQVSYDPAGKFESLRGDVTGTDNFDFVVTDGSSQVSKTATVTIQGAWDKPTDIGLSNASVDEDAADTVVGTLSTVDPDAGDTFIYSIQPGGDGSQFVIDGSQLKVGATALDYETGATRSVTVRSTDAGGEFFDETFSIGVNDVNEPSPSGALGFESGDLTGWSRIGTADVVGSAPLLNESGSVTPTEGSYMGRIHTHGVGDREIESFLGLSSGKIDAAIDSNATIGSAIKQSVQVEAGDIVSFDWLFDAGDYYPFDDASFFMTQNGAAEELADISDVGDYGNSGWRTETFTVANSGTMELGFGVVNSLDQGVDSQLFIDNVVIA